MCYARSADGGKTWTNSKGVPYSLPVTAKTAEIASPITQNSELINQTSMTADSDGNPYIATYYRAAGSDAPQFHVIYTDSGGQWKDISTGFRKTPFSLKGAGTKKIPISRPLLVCSSGNGSAKQWYLIFRDEERGSRVSMAVCSDLQENKWTVSDLTDYSVGDWEPTFDTELWKNKNALHLFVQKTLQNDGERNSELEAQPITVLKVALGQKQAANDVIEIINKVNNHWQATHPASGSNAFWHPAAYHTGNMEAYSVTGNEEYRKYSEAWAQHNRWKGAKSDNKADWRYSYGETDNFVLFGDWQICFQTYIDLYMLDRKPENEYMTARALEVMEYQMSTTNSDYWWWADGLYMVMPVMTKLYALTGNELYLQKLYEYFSYARQLMYDSEAGLFYRDAKYIFPKHKTGNGLKDFWSRGNGWVFAGLAKVLRDLPATDAHRTEYVEIFKTMAAALKDAQQPEGHWTRSLLDPAHAPGYETSGTAFFTYGFLWGINNGILEKDAYLPVVTESWRYLTETALQLDGTVGFVQPIGERADQHRNVGPNTTSDFGVGAFLLAASEMTRYVSRQAQRGISALRLTCDIAVYSQSSAADGGSEPSAVLSAGDAFPMDYEIDYVRVYQKK
jgi:rhamnogalacturonyl hydrolase YesR